MDFYRLSCNFHIVVGRVVRSKTFYTARNSVKCLLILWLVVGNISKLFASYERRGIVKVVVVVVVVVRVHFLWV